MKLKLYYVDGGNHPVLGQVYHQCQKVIGGSDVVRYQRYLANILTFIAESVNDCDRILTDIEMIEKGQVSEFEIEGNDVDVLISHKNIQVNININDDWIGQPEGKFSLNEFKVVITGWRRFLQIPESLSSEMVIDLPEGK